MGPYRVGAQGAKLQKNDAQKLSADASYAGAPASAVSDSSSRWGCSSHRGLSARRSRGNRMPESKSSSPMVLPTMGWVPPYGGKLVDDESCAR
jgi:hypothetical protein